ncbi:MAG: TauD/TfdA family dioxygenase [Pseudomonadota bacterium]
MLEQREQALRLTTSDEELLLPFAWLRDNCQCEQCFVPSLGEKTFALASLNEAPTVANAAEQGDTLLIHWSDGHQSQFTLPWLIQRQRRDSTAWQGWRSGFSLPECDFESFAREDACAEEAIARFSLSGALLLKNAPCETGAMELLQHRLGPIREVVFGRLHSVVLDPGGYNIALTSLALPPHSDLASMSHPPSLQGLHMISNQCSGGESIIVDGWAVAESLRAEHPDWFDLLCTTSVPFRIFDRRHETRSFGPVISLNTANEIRGFRYSNQTMQALPLNTPCLDEFYKAYTELSRRILSAKWQHLFRLNTGEMLLVHNHRVLHGRTAFRADGERHLEDAYFDWENCMAHRIVLRREIQQALEQ